MDTYEDGAFCDPDLHDGRRHVADYMVFQGYRVGGDAYPYQVRRPDASRAYACCTDHLSVALDYVMADGSHVIVRRETVR